MIRAREKSWLGASVTVIGAGNIGSLLLPHLARLTGVGRIVCVDPDRYSECNRLTQAITGRDVGVPKAIAAARYLRQIRDNLKVVAVVARVEDVPWGLLRGGVICSCVDNSETRLRINVIAWRLGVPWVDAGIRAEELLARVSVFVPNRAAPCFACAWGEKDYARNSQIYSCSGARRETPPTGAQTSLGGLAAGMQAIECQKLLEGRTDQSLAGRQVLLEAGWHHSYITVLRRREDCRFDHESYGPLRHLAADSTVDQLTALGAVREGSPLAVVAEGKNWVTRLGCGQCGRQVGVLRLQGRIGERRLRCICGGRRAPIGFDLRPRLTIDAADAVLRGRRLPALGLSVGDIVRLESAEGEQTLVELVGE